MNGSVFGKIASLIILIISLPLLATIALMVKLTSAGPVIYRHKRVGYKGQEFTLYKFRSMTDRSERPDDVVLPGDQRVTRVGRILRSTHLDELPQLWNVLKGDMAFIGPRPMPFSELQKAMIEHPRYAELADLRPGLTGPAQIRGRLWKVGNEREVLEMNLRYARNGSLATDALIIWQTMMAVVRRQGV